jgi:hypothetical protein
MMIAEHFPFFTARPLMVDLQPVGQRLIMALRLTVLAQRREVDAQAVLRERFGCANAARQALHIIYLAGDLWPERFTMSPPCCRTLSHDEALLGAMAGHVAAANRPAYDQAACDLLNEDIRDQLWRELTRWQP